MTTEELEFSEVGRAPWNVKLLAIWGVALIGSGAVLGFSIAWIYPAIHRLWLRLF